LAACPFFVASLVLLIASLAGNGENIDAIGVILIAMKV